MEAAGLCLFMISACGAAVLLEHPSSPVRHLVHEAWARRVLMGAAMGATAAAIVYSPIGKQSGAHLNPSVTIAFWALGRIERSDALFYVIAQFAGGLAGVALSSLLLGPLIADPSVNYVVTAPGRYGAAVALVAEIAISFVLMHVVLASTARPRIARWTGAWAAILVAVYIAVEAPLSGMSMNPARSWGSASFAGAMGGVWIYFVGPPLGMLLAARLHAHPPDPAPCPKLHHENSRRCIFCGRPALKGDRMETIERIRRARKMVLSVASRLAWLPPTIARWSLGLLFAQTGWAKINNLAGITEYFAKLGIPAPGFNAVLASGTELVGGLLLIAGLGVRLAAIPLAFTMIVAIITAKAADIEGISDLIRLSEFDYIVLFAWIAVAGPGPLSLDHALSRLLAKDAEPPALAERSAA
jgi:aquaporin Z